MTDRQLTEHFTFLYGADRAEALTVRLLQILDTYKAGLGDGKRPFPTPNLTEKDAVLITYGDMVQEDGAAPLHTLSQFLKQTVADAISTVHILPFYPYSSDDGFSVIDYKAVNPSLGNWDNIAEIGQDFRLMFDAVINHISAKSDWFQRFLDGDEQVADYFITIAPDTDLSAVFRPRTLPLLTSFETATGVKHVWTTFSADQIDLNFSNPDLLLDVLQIMLGYVSQGAELIRLDAVGFIWKEVGTRCLHLPQAHRIIQLMRSVLDRVAPHIILITETNVPHEENIAYFGNGRNEAQLVYNFSLPPLTLHAFHTGSTETLSRWASTLTVPSDETTFFNFLASHDGIGMTPARGLLSDAAISQMAQRVEALGGYVSYKNNGDGSKSAYELNVNYLDALGNPDQPDEDLALTARRFLAAQTIMLALRGVPGIYFHSLFGSRSWRDGVVENGRYRTINRQKLERAAIEAELADPDSLRHHVFSGYRTLLQQRAAHPAFDPNGEQQVIQCHPSVFALLRTTKDGRFPILCLHNVAYQDSEVVIDLSNMPFYENGRFTDLLTQQHYPFNNNQLVLTMAPYQVLWLGMRVK